MNDEVRSVKKWSFTTRVSVAAPPPNSQRHIIIFMIEAKKKIVIKMIIYIKMDIAEKNIWNIDVYLYYHYIFEMWSKYVILIIIIIILF